MMNAAAQTAELNQLKASNAVLAEEISLLRQQIQKLKRMLFGTQSEKLRAELLGQLALFENLPDDKDTPSEPKKRVVERHERRAPVRRPLPEDLEEREIHHDLDEADKSCTCCGTELTHIGVITSKKVGYIPAQLEMEKHIQHKYTCKVCDGVDNEGSSIVSKPMPKSILPKAFAAATLLAYIIVSKYEDALPLYRLEKSFTRLNISLSRKTMTHWVLKLSDSLARLHELMLEKIKEAPWVGIDETRMELTLHERKKTKKHRRGKRFQGQMWVIHCELPKPIVVFRYEDTRTQELARNILEGYRGTFMSDGHGVYNISSQSKPGKDSRDCGEMTHAVCLVHCRRKFTDLLSGKDEPLDRRTVTGRVLYRMQLLYKLEKAAKHWTLEQRGEQRNTKSRRLMNAMKRDLERALTHPKRRPVGKLKEAIAYALKRWDVLTVFLDVPHLPLDNNGTENKIRPFVVGRKNWLHASSRRGATANGVMYSLISTAQANGLNTYDYLVKLFKELPYAETKADLEALLPIQ